jgi:hypothetical protein
MNKIKIPIYWVEYHSGLMHIETDKTKEEIIKEIEEEGLETFIWSNDVQIEESEDIEFDKYEFLEEGE